LAEGLHDWGMRAVPLFGYTLAFVLQLRKSTENLSQGSRLVFRLVVASSRAAVRVRETHQPEFSGSAVSSLPQSVTFKAEALANTSI
jgi:hypothetical protein